jgi:hypothetical protein
VVCRLEIQFDDIHERLWCGNISRSSRSSNIISKSNSNVEVKVNVNVIVNVNHNRTGNGATARLGKTARGSVSDR